IGTHQSVEFDTLALDPVVATQLTQSVTFTQFGGALQTDVALGATDAVLLGFEYGAASGDRGAYGFGARPWRSGNGNLQPTAPGNAKPLGLEFNAGITYDTSDKFHAGVAYGLLIPFTGLRNQATSTSASVAHAARFILAIPF